MNSSPSSAKRLEEVHRIAVLRPNAVGDFVFALPALVALRAAYLEAHIVLLARRWHREFLRERPAPVDEVIELPPVPGVGASPGEPADLERIDRFVAEMQSRRFDLALQMYGGGRYSNPFLHRLRPGLTAGLCTADAAPLDRSIEYRPWQNERLRLLEVVGLVGATPVDLAPPLAVIERDHAELRACIDLPERPVVVLQPGATDPRRRWPAERFAAVGDALAGLGAMVVINGDAAERALAACVAQAMHASAIDVSGSLSLSGLAALLERATVLVSNDTGPLHLADAIGTRTVGLYLVLNLITSAPLVGARQRHRFSIRTMCPVCGAENVHVRCPHDVCFIDDIETDQVIGLALEAFKESAACAADAALA
ncbi:MAG TPA: glycosyltransferase family 9 protein [Burkholderiaceae bacterium]|nr:glycosyltransferase family 9 protein [Burkholderiaceae bacterium]